MKFSKGQMIKIQLIRYNKGIPQNLSGQYEIIKTGKRIYLFSNSAGIDLYLTKKELEAIIQLVTDNNSK